MKTIFLHLILSVLCVAACSCSKSEQNVHPSEAEPKQNPVLFLEIELTDRIATYLHLANSSLDSGHPEEVLTTKPTQREEDLRVHVVEDIYAIFKKLSTDHSADTLKIVFIRVLHKQLQLNSNLDNLDIAFSNLLQSSDLPCYTHWKAEVLSAISDVYGCVDSPPNLLDSFSCFGAFLDRIVAANNGFTTCMKQYEID